MKSREIHSDRWQITAQYPTNSSLQTGRKAFASISLLP